MPVRILLIEDSPVDRELARHALTLLASAAGPAEVVSAGAWHEAWPHLLAGAVDVILLDLLLPTLGGLEILEELRERPHPPVIVLSAQDDLATAVETLRAGAHDYVRKSGDWGPALRRAVERVLTRTRLERELASSHTHLLAYAASLERQLATQSAAGTRMAEVENLALRAEQTARLKAEIVANVSHELRTPLNGVLGYADLLADQLPAESTTPDARQLLHALRRQAERLSAVVASVLSVERLASGREPVTISRFSLAALAAELRADASVLNAEKGLTINWRTPRRGAVVEHDREKIRAITVQLLSNAIKFTHAGRVRVALEPTASGGVVLTVEDTGIGFPAEARAAIFDDFVQLDGSSTRRYAGLGLGLGIVKRATALLGGTPYVTSVPGKGTIVRVELPPPSPRRRRLH